MIVLQSLLLNIACVHGYYSESLFNFYLSLIIILGSLYVFLNDN